MSGSKAESATMNSAYSRERKFEARKKSFLAPKRSRSKLTTLNWRTIAIWKYKHRDRLLATRSEKEKNSIRFWRSAFLFADFQRENMWKFFNFSFPLQSNQTRTELFFADAYSFFGLFVCKAKSFPSKNFFVDFELNYAVKTICCRMHSVFSQWRSFWIKSLILKRRRLIKYQTRVNLAPKPSNSSRFY